MSASPVAYAQNLAETRLISSRVWNLETERRRVLKLALKASQRLAWEYREFGT